MKGHEIYQKFGPLYYKFHKNDPFYIDLFSEDKKNFI